MSNNKTNFDFKIVSGQSCVIVEANGLETEVFVPVIQNNRIHLVNTQNLTRKYSCAEIQINKLNDIEMYSKAVQVGKSKVNIKNNLLLPTKIVHQNDENITPRNPIANSTPTSFRTQNGAVNVGNFKFGNVHISSECSTGYGTQSGSILQSTGEFVNYSSSYSNLINNNTSKNDHCMLLTPEVVRRFVPLQSAVEISIPEFSRNRLKSNSHRSVVNTYNTHPKKISNELIVSPLQSLLNMEQQQLNISEKQHISAALNNSSFDLPHTPSFEEQKSTNNNLSQNESFLNVSTFSPAPKWAKCLTPVRTYLRHRKFKMLSPKKQATPRHMNGSIIIPDYLHNPTKGIEAINPIKIRSSKLIIDETTMLSEKILEEPFHTTEDLQRSEFYFPRTKVEMKRQRYTAFDLITIPNYHLCIGRQLKNQFLKGCRKRSCTTNPKFKFLVRDIKSLEEVEAQMQGSISNYIHPKKLRF